MRVKPGSISLQRRHLMIAGAAAAVIPAGWFFTTRVRAANFAAPAPAEAHATTLVASGRLTTADGKPLAGATVHAWYSCAPQGANNEHACVITTDADGRFVFSTIAPHVSADGIQPMHVYVRHQDIEAHHSYVTFGPDRSLPEAVVAQTLLDHDTLRACFSLTVA